MSHSPLQLRNVGVEFSTKLCFSNFTANIHYQQRIGIIGRNGAGKSTLLSIIQGIMEPTTGSIIIPQDAISASVPQIIEAHQDASGGERFNKTLSGALAEQPNILCLDEPTNHLDSKNRRSLLQMLRNYKGTLIIISHDPELLRTAVTTLWKIDNGQVTIFAGNYDDFVQESSAKRTALLQHVERLKREKKISQKAYAAEQQRAARSKRMHRDENDRSLREKYKETGSRTSSKKKGRILELQDTIARALQEQSVPEIILPQFSLTAAEIANSKAVVSITDGTCGYNTPIISHISLQVSSRERVALIGANGAGKSTLIHAILNDRTIKRTGMWHVIPYSQVGYLDQHYSTLLPNQNVFQAIKTARADWHDLQIRKHLNDFLFRTNEEVHASVSTLSGGEKARLSLALIAAQTPKLLILDEITNNLDLETRRHIIEVLTNYPGALLVISHDEEFLREIGITTRYEIANGKIRLM